MPQYNVKVRQVVIDHYLIEADSLSEIETELESGEHHPQASEVKESTVIAIHQADE